MPPHPPHCPHELIVIWNGLHTRDGSQIAHAESVLFEDLERLAGDEHFDQRATEHVVEVVFALSNPEAHPIRKVGLWNVVGDILDREIRVLPQVGREVCVLRDRCVDAAGDEVGTVTEVRMPGTGDRPEVPDEQAGPLMAEGWLRVGSSGPLGSAFYAAGTQVADVTTTQDEGVVTLTVGRPDLHRAG